MQRYWTRQSRFHRISYWITGLWALEAVLWAMVIAAWLVWHVLQVSCVFTLNLVALLLDRGTAGQHRELGR